MLSTAARLKVIYVSGEIGLRLPRWRDLKIGSERESLVCLSFRHGYPYGVVEMIIEPIL